jgi:hypothetical protein
MACLEPSIGRNGERDTEAATAQKTLAEIQNHHTKLNGAEPNSWVLSDKKQDYDNSHPTVPRHQQLFLPVRSSSIAPNKTELFNSAVSMFFVTPFAANTPKQLDSRGYIPTGNVRCGCIRKRSNIPSTCSAWNSRFLLTSSGTTRIPAFVMACAAVFAAA